MLTVYETLKDIDSDITRLQEYWGNQYLRNILEHAFIPEMKFILPEGVPPYQDKGMSYMQTKGIFWQEARKMYTYCRADIKPLQRESMFIQALEALDSDSQKILIAIKEQTLDKLFPNITYDKLKEVGYLK